MEKINVTETETLICHDEDCGICGANAQERTCWGCGAKGIVTDCGDMAQPRPIAAGRLVNGEVEDMHRTYCEACCS